MKATKADIKISDFVLWAVGYGAAVNAWLRSANRGNANNAWNVNSTGYVNNNNAYNANRPLPDCVA